VVVEAAAAPAGMIEAKPAIGENGQFVVLPQIARPARMQIQSPILEVQPATGEEIVEQRTPPGNHDALRIGRRIRTVHPVSGDIVFERGRMCSRTHGQDIHHEGLVGLTVHVFQKSPLPVRSRLPGEVKAV
jgi:hypothetical protein